MYLSNALGRIGEHYGLVAVPDPNSSGGLEELHRVIGQMYECRTSGPWFGFGAVRDRLSA